MSDIIATLKKAQTVVEQVMSDKYIRELMDLETLHKEIEEAIKMPEIRIDIPVGQLAVGVSHCEASQAYIDLYYAGGCEKNLLLAECVDEPLRTDGEQEGDIRMYAWADFHNEDYTWRDSITASEISSSEDGIRYLEENDKKTRKALPVKRDTTRKEMKNLRKGDTFRVNGVEHTASDDAHICGDASFDDEYIVFDETGDGWTESDFA